MLIRQAMQVIDVSYTGNRIEAVKHLIAILKDPESDLYQALNYDSASNLQADIIRKINFIETIMANDLKNTDHPQIRFNF